jgi:hypothetical protein
MEEYYECLLEELGPAMKSRKVSLFSLEAYAGTLPQQLLNQWHAYGWCGYGEGIFWTVNPVDYEVTMRSWLLESGIPDPDTYHVIARGAFGDIYMWQQGTGSWLTVSAVYARYTQTTRHIPTERFDDEIKIFFASFDHASNDFEDLFEKALTVLGPLEPDEMYGFVPAIALGGPADLKHMQKVKTIEHLTFLSQLAPLADWGFPDLDSL